MAQTGPEPPLPDGRVVVRPGRRLVPGGATTSFRPGGFGTVFELLSHFSIPWKNYYSNLPSSLLFPYLGSKYADNIVPIATYFADAAAGTLPPSAWWTELHQLVRGESPGHPKRRAVCRLGHQRRHGGPGWPETMLIWLYDEHGGYYDHVAPRPAVRPDDIAPDVPTAELDGDLFRLDRLPGARRRRLPWARRNYVSHVVHDHTSVLKLLETKWNLPALSNRDANASTCSTPWSWAPAGRPSSPT